MASLVSDLASFWGQIEVVPANDTVLDQAVAGFGDFLIFLFGLGELSRISDFDCASEPIG